MIERKVKRLVVVLTSVESKEVLERWEFKVEYETEDEAGDADKKVTKQVILREVREDSLRMNAA